MLGSFEVAEMTLEKVGEEFHGNTVPV